MVLPPSGDLNRYRPLRKAADAQAFGHHVEGGRSERWASSYTKFPAGILGFGWIETANFGMADPGLARTAWLD
jgi:hypothetical protein